MSWLTYLVIVFCVLAFVGIVWSVILVERRRRRHYEAFLRERRVQTSAPVHKSDLPDDVREAFDSGVMTADQMDTFLKMTSGD